MATYTREDREWADKACSTPTARRAGDVLDYGYAVETFRANGYWAMERGMPLSTWERRQNVDPGAASGVYATLEEARAAAQAHDADVLSARTTRAEPGIGGPHACVYRVVHRVRTFRDPHTHEERRRAWGWVDLGGPAANSPTYQIPGTSADFVELPAFARN